jgi:phosphoenolpyruvate---glycerone phosphotransferase subunit DhaK
MPQGRRQFVNDPQTHVAEALEGFELAHRDLVALNREPAYVTRRELSETPKVGLVAGGGSGHEPLHAGFIGTGMLDAAVPGLIFSSPTAIQVEAAMRAIDQGRGVLQIIKNYTGDVMNFQIAAELVAADGIAVERVLVDDDLATDSVADGPGRRGTAAVIAVEKICGAAAERGAELGDLAALGARVVEGARTMALAFSSCAHPGESEPSFELEPTEVELGVGIHGERGIDRVPFGTAAELTARLVDPLVEALELRSGDRVLAIVNGLGATQPLELSVVFKETVERLGAGGIEVARSLVGTYVPALDMAGASVTLVRVDDELLDLWDAPARTVALVR